MHGAVHRQWQREEVKGVEASADVTTGLTLHLGPELAMEKVDYDRPVSA